MKLKSVSIKNFRRLEDVSIGLEQAETVFVGANNSGKTSATAAFRCFIGNQEFKLHDFSVGKILDLDAFGDSGDPDLLPEIELDLWFSIDPDSIEFGRAYSLLPNLSDDFDELGLRLTFAASDPARLHAEFTHAYPEPETDGVPRRLSAFLSKDGMLKRHFGMRYASLESAIDETIESALDVREGPRLLAMSLDADIPKRRLILW